MSAVLRARGLGKRYRQRWALADCDLDVPAGKVVGLVGLNGAGKSTTLNLAAGMLAPTTGTIEVCGGRPGQNPAQLAKVGFVAQDTPTYAALSVADHLALGARLNPGWDDALARDRIHRIGLDPARPAGRLSGGQRAQLALTLGIAKRPELLVLDEPVAALDPLARREFMEDLTVAAQEHAMSVVLSSHLVSDIERVCDHLIVLVASRVQVAGDIDALLASHHRLTGPRHEHGGLSAPALPDGSHIVSTTRTDGRTTLLVRTAGPVDGPVHAPAELAVAGWTTGPVPLEDVVLAYMSASRPALADRASRPTLESLR
ncbi:ABC transporter ATP-binding protein [Streptomyces sp. NPDC091267]|uniref:ABC transporter ATP-binding protein n=1 Tax=Streptomyces sp. NPDC091267 TaxID=3155195 RepID=UPI003428E03D